MPAGYGHIRYAASSDMLNRQQAQDLVEGMIGEIDGDSDDWAVVQAESTIEKPWGWIFFYQSRKYLETGEFSCQLLGNSPIFVNRKTGIAWVSGTAESVEEYIQQYESQIGYSPDAA
jgi:hypothetical protein